MKYFAEIVDHWEEELDIMGPFNSEEDANTAAFDKWNGDNNMAEIRIVKSVPVSASFFPSDKNIFVQY